MLLFAVAVCGVVYLSIPSERTLVEMSRDDTDATRTRQLLERIYGRDPGDLRAALDLADFYAANNEGQKALDVLRDIDARKPGDAGVRSRIGMAMLHAGEMEQALDFVPEGRRSREFLLLAADKFEERGDLRNAEAMLLAAMAAEGAANPAVWMRIAHWRWDMYDTDGAADALRHVLAIRPNDARALEFYFRNRVWALDAPEAVRIAGRLEQIAPLDRTHLSALRNLQLSLRDIDGAARTMEKIAALPDSIPEDALSLGIFLYGKGDVAGGDEALFNLAIRPGISDVMREDVARRLAQSAIRNKNLDLAARLAEFTATPSMAEAGRLALISVAMELGRFDIASKCVRPLLADPGAGPDILLAGLELAYRSDDYAGIAALHDRLEKAGVPIDEVIGSLPGPGRTPGEWLRASEGKSGRAFALAGWLREAMRVNFAADAHRGEGPSPMRVPRADVAATAARLLPLADSRAPAVVAAVVDAVSAYADAATGGNSRQWMLEQADRLADAASAGPLSRSAEFARTMADLAEQSGNAERAFARWKEIVRREPDNPAAWIGLSRAASVMRLPGEAWDAASTARSLLGDDGDPSRRALVAAQLLAAADALPGTDPSREEKTAAARAYAEDALARQWDSGVARSLFRHFLGRRELARAREYAGQLKGDPEIHAAMAEAFFANNQRDAALAEIALAASSTDRLTILRMAGVLAAAGEKEAAREFLARGMAMPGGDTQDYLLQLADAHGALGEYDRQYDLVLRRARAGGEREWLDAVDRHIWGGDLEGALLLLAEMGAAYPQSVEIADRTLRALADANRPGDVLATFSRAIGNVPDIEDRLSADALASLAVSADNLRLTPRARRFFRLALAKDRGNYRGCFGYARLLRRDGNLAGAVIQLRNFLEAAPDDAWGWLELANTLSQSGKNGRPEYSMVVTLTEPDARGRVAREVLAARALALRVLGREKEAMAILRDAVGMRIDNPDIACDYAQMLMETGRYDEAETILRETAGLFPYHAWAYRLEATILVRRKKYDLAVDRLKEALTWVPHDGEVQRDLGFAAQLWERPWASQKGWLTAGDR